MGQKSTYTVYILYVCVITFNKWLHALGDTNQQFMKHQVTDCDKHKPGDFET